MTRACCCLLLCLLLNGCAGRNRQALLTPARAAATKAPPVYRVRFTTTQGPFTLEVHRDWAPLGADRFYYLVKHRYYDGSYFFRVLPKFVVQFGIHPDPAVNQAWKKTEIKDDPVKEGNQVGTMAFATDGPNTRTVQVFINKGDNRRLDARGFSPFARVTEGMAVVDRLYAEYGENAPRGKGVDQDKMEAEGELYIKRDFPKLDRILSARLLR